MKDEVRGGFRVLGNERFCVQPVKQRVEIYGLSTLLHPLDHIYNMITPITHVHQFLNPLIIGMVARWRLA